jgi:hypothetical protein
LVRVADGFCDGVGVGETVDVEIGVGAVVGVGDCEGDGVGVELDEVVGFAEGVGVGAAV